MNRKIKENKPCRVCGEIPEEGYYFSRAARSDWTCPKCCAEQSKAIRESKIKKFEKENENA